jgi:hypothetical protein
LAKIEVQKWKVLLTHSDRKVVRMKNKKGLTNYEKHLVPCSNCGRDVLDHMTQCPFCKKAISPLAYKPIDPGKLKKVKLVLTIIGGAIAVILLFLSRGR